MSREGLRIREYEVKSQYELLAQNCGETEGPVALTDEIAFVSMTRGRIGLLNGTVARFLDTGGFPNGLAADNTGALFVAQAGDVHRPAKWGPLPRDVETRPGGVQVVRPSGIVEYVSQEPVSPNDLCFGPDGNLYITDPTRQPSRDDGRLWRCDPSTGRTELLARLDWYPNGIAFSAEDVLYVASTGAQEIVRYRLNGGRLGDGQTAFRLKDGYPDGMAFDADGHLMVAAIGSDTAPSTIQIWTESGVLVDVIRPREGGLYRNIAFRDRTLVVADQDSIIAVHNWPCSGLPLHPFR